MNRPSVRIPMLTVATSLLLAGVLFAQQQYGPPPDPVRAADAVPEKFKGVGITQNLDAQLPLDAGFVDENGRAVKLGDYFDGERPVVLVLVYYRCPSLCGVVLNSTLTTLKQVPATAGEDFEVVVVSFEPTETPRLAFQKRLGYVAEYGRAAGEKSWHFLTGPQASIDRLCERIGFGYKWNEATQEWVHDAAIFIATGKGRMSRYLFPNGFSDPRTTRLALTEASAGKVGSLADVLVWRCSHYDAEEGTYAASAMKIVKTASPLLAAMILLPLFVVLWIARRRRLRNQTPTNDRVATA